MNLEEKANEYEDGLNISYWARPMPIHHFKNGYKECLSDLKDFIKANPKITADKITEYLNSL